MDAEAIKKRILEHTNNGMELVDFMVDVMRDSKVHHKYRIEAAQWLADRAFGKVKDAEPSQHVLRIEIGGVQVPGVSGPVIDVEPEKLPEPEEKPEEDGDGDGR